MSRFPCIALGAQIDALACVERQSSERCFCPKAPIAISEVSDSPSINLRISRELPILRSRAEGMYRKPPAQRYAGPALSVHNKQVQQGADDRPPAAERSAPEVSTPDPIPAAVIPATGDEATKSGTAPVVEPVDPRPEVPSGTGPRVSLRGSENSRHGSVCKVCGRALRLPNATDYCRLCRTKGKGNVVPIKTDVEKIEVEEQLRKNGDQAAAFHRSLREEEVDEGAAERLAERVAFNKALSKAVDDPRQYRFFDAGPGLPDVKGLPHDYLVACVKEARRRIEEMEGAHVHALCCNATVETRQTAQEG